MDLMDDEDLKKDVIGQMMGELEDVTSSDLKRKSPVKGVEIAITVSPKSEEEASEDGDMECTDPDCEDPMHDHAAKEEEPADYISSLIKKLG